MHDKQDKAGSRLNDWNTGAILTKLGLNSVASLAHIEWDFISTPGYLKNADKHLATYTLARGLNISTPTTDSQVNELFEGGGILCRC
jgi:hypothetical protein